MIKKVFATALLALTAGATNAQTAKSWTLQDCINYALANNIQIKKNQASLQSAEVDVKEAKAAFLPTVSGSLSQTATYRPFQESATSYVNGSTTSSSSSKITQAGTYGITGSWVVWNGHKTRYNFQNSQLSQAIAEYAVSTQANSIQEQIVQLYVQILYMEEAYKVNSELLLQDSTIYARGEEMVKQGKMSGADLAQLRSQVSSGRYDLVNTRTQIDNYKMQLRQLLELSPTDDIDIAGISLTEAQVLTALPSKLDVYNAALAHRPEIKSSELAIQQSDLQYKIAKTTYYPTVSLTAGLNDNHMTGSGNNFFTQIKQNFNANIGVSVSIPIYDNRSTKSNVERAQISKLTSQLDLQSAQKQLWTNVETYWLNAKNYQASYLAAKSNVESLEASNRLVNEQFNVGLKNIAELLQSRGNLLSAKQTMLQDKYTAVLNATLLRFYQGSELSI